MIKISKFHHPIKEEDKKKFIEVLRETDNGRLAARACGFALRSFQEHKKKDQEFSDAWDEARDEAVDILKREAWRRAFAGTRKPIMYQGKVIGVVREYDTDLIKFLMEASHPEIYARRYRTEITGRAGKDLIPEVNTIEIARRISFLLTQAIQQKETNKIPIIEVEDKQEEVVH